MSGVGFCQRTPLSLAVSAARLTQTCVPARNVGASGQGRPSLDGPTDISDAGSTSSLNSSKVIRYLRVHSLALSIMVARLLPPEKTPIILYVLRIPPVQMGPVRMGLEKSHEPPIQRGSCDPYSPRIGYCNCNAKPRPVRNP